MTIADIFLDLPRLESERLILRRLSMDDDRDLFIYSADPEVTKYVLWETHRSIEDARAYISTVLESYHNGQVSVWGFEEKASGRLIGTGGFGNWSPADARAEIGYSLARPWWNRGLTTEATRTIVTFGFGVMNLTRIEAHCEPANVASARVMEKCGMRFEGTMRERMFVKGRYRDLKVYSILRSEWEML